MKSTTRSISGAILLSVMLIIVPSAEAKSPRKLTKAPVATPATTKAVDSEPRTVAAEDQGTSTSDVEMTAQIRKEVAAAKNLSANALNVRIVTNHGRVTLRGPVKTEAEKSIIGDIAIRIARADHVDNQLEVPLLNVADQSPTQSPK